MDTHTLTVGSSALHDSSSSKESSGVPATADHLFKATTAILNAAYTALDAPRLDVEQLVDGYIYGKGVK